MSAGSFFGTTTGKLITVGGVAVVAIGIAAAVLMQGDGYRSIAVQEVAGNVAVVGEKNNGQAYVGEHLYSGDDVTVGDASELTMCMDNDKYVYADANTHFRLEASAAKDDSLIKIYLDAGSELNELQSKLDSNDTYEVDTPNSTMSVRGTKFRVTVYKAKDGLIYTLTEVKDGEVLVRLKTTDGTYNGVERLFTPGQSTLIRGNSDFSEFVTSDKLDNADLSDLADEDTVLMLAYDSLPENGLERLIALLENGGLIDEEDESEEKIKAEVTPAPGTTPSPKLSAEANAALTDGTNELEPIDSLHAALQSQIKGRDHETGGLILKDGTVFDPAYYAKENPDVVKYFGSDTDSLLDHYLKFGKNEDRAPSLKAALKKEEAYRQFAEALKEEEVTPAGEEKKDDNSSSSNGGSQGGGNTKTYPTVNGGLNYNGGTMPMTATLGSSNANDPNNGIHATLTGYSFGNAAYNSLAIDDPNANVTLNNGFTLTDPNDPTNYTSYSELRHINWGQTANGVTVGPQTSYKTGSSYYGGQYSVTKNSNSSYTFSGTDSSGTPIQPQTFTNDVDLLSFLGNNI